MGYAFPNPCIALLQVIPIDIKGIANAKILKYPTPILIILSSFVNILRMFSENVRKKIAYIIEIVTDTFNAKYIKSFNKLFF